MTNRPIYEVDNQASDLEPLFESEDFWDYSSNSTPIVNHVFKNQCIELNIVDKGKNRIIHINYELPN